MRRLNCYHILIVWIVLLAVACKDTISKNEKTKNPIPKMDSAIVDFQFNDTVQINNNTIGSLVYNLSLDSLDLNKIDSRYTLLYLTTEEGISSLEDILNVNHEIFIDTIGNGTFHFNVKFLRTGKNELNGIIEDKIILNEVMEDNNIPIISRETSFLWPVYVEVPSEHEY